MDGSLGIMYGVAFTVCEGSWDSGSCVPNLFVVVSLSWMVDTLDDGYERNINIYRSANTYFYDRKSLIQNTKCSVPKSFGSHFQAFLIFLVIVLSSGCVSGIAVLLVDTNLGYH